MVRSFLALGSLAFLAACEIGDSGTGSASGDGGASGTHEDASVALVDGGAVADASKVAPEAGAESLVSSFVFVGCNRLQKADWDPKINPSSANSPQLVRTFGDIVALPDRPRFFFFTGDLVLSLDKDTTVLEGQLAGWAGIYKGDPISSKVPLVPLVGNHEMLYKDKSGTELSNGPADAVWTKWLATQGLDVHAGNGPTTADPNDDALQDDQSKLSYSFDDGGTHFVLLNTDTWTTTKDKSTGDTQIGWMALHWLTADLAAAQASPSVSRIFVFGHKPIVSPLGDATSSGSVNPALNADFAALLDKTPKVKGYFAAHAHEWDARKLPGTRGVFQIVAGNGGSQLESGLAVPVPFFGFTEARVYSTGRIAVTSHQRPAPTPYNATTVSAAMPASELTIAQ